MPKRGLMGAPPRRPERKESQFLTPADVEDPEFDAHNVAMNDDSSVSSHSSNIIAERPPAPRRGSDATPPPPPRGRGVGLMKKISSRFFVRVGDDENDSSSDSEDDNNDEPKANKAPKPRPSLVQRASSRFVLSSKDAKKVPSKRRVARSDYGQNGAAFLKLMAGSKRALRVQEIEASSTFHSESSSTSSPLTRRTSRDNCRTRRSRLADMDVPEVEDKRTHYDQLPTRPTRERRSPRTATPEAEQEGTAEDQPGQAHVEPRQQRPGFVKAVSRRMKLSSRKLQV